MESKVDSGLTTRLIRRSAFHDVGSLFPGEVDLLTVSATAPVEEALRLMNEHRFSQLPVVENGTIRGVFSLWSLAQHLANYPDIPLRDLPVEDVMEQIPMVRVDQSLDEVLEMLKRHESLLVVSPHGIQAVVTATDVLDYFYRVARPFVLLQEIELALRDLIELCTKGDVLQACIDRALKQYFDDMGRPPPSSLQEMNFEAYRSIVMNKDNWPLFEGVLGRNRAMVGSKLERVRDIRNIVFHFREDISVLDRQALATTRQWLLDKTRSLADREDREGRHD